MKDKQLEEMNKELIQKPSEIIKSTIVTPNISKKSSNKAQTRPPSPFKLILIDEPVS